MGLYPKNLKEYVLAQGIPLGRYSKVFVVDPNYGATGAHGQSFDAACAGVEEAFAKMTDGHNDVIVMAPGVNASAIAAAILWNKSYAHLLGLGGPLAVGQRCRITGSAALDASQVITVSGNGCVFKNVQFYNGADADADCGAAIVSGQRNYFENVFFAGMAHATPAARAASWSLKVSGSENLFRECAIGLDTIIRAAANAELVYASGATRNIFHGCRFLSYSETAGKFLASFADGMDRWVEFRDCIFQNFSVNWATTLTDAFNVLAAATHQIILRGENQLVGITGWANTVTRISHSMPQPHNTGGTLVAPAA